MNTRSIRIATATAALVLVAGPALAAGATATTQVSVIGPEIAIEKETDMNLGTVAKPSTGTYTVTIAPGGARSGSGGSGGQLIGGAGQTATFSVTGESNRDFTISTPATITLTTGGGGANKEVVFTPQHAATDNTGPGASGYAETVIEVHGQLAVPASVQNGAYSTTLPVTVEYQ